MKTIMISFLCLVLLTLTYPVFSQVNMEVNSGKLLIPRYGLSAVTDGKWVYAIGGAHFGANGGKEYAVSGLLAAYERINPISLESIFFADGLYRRANHASVMINGGILSCGGRTQNGLNRQRTSNCEFFNPNNLQLRSYPALPNRHRTLGMAKVDEKVYAIGGLSDGKPEERFVYSSKTYLLDNKKLTWKLVADMPFPREGVVVAVNDFLYALGGYNGKLMNSVLEFDTEKHEWKQKKDLPYGLSAFAAITDGDSIFIFGDYKKQSSIHRYDTKSGDLFLLNKKITPRRHLAAVKVNEKVIVVGGNQDSFGQALSVIESFDLTSLRNSGEMKSR